MPTPYFSIAALVLSLALPAASAAELSYYLPADGTYDPAIPTPASFLGFEVGDRHVRHDQLVAYLTELARLSDRLDVATTGTTYEGRPLTLLTVSSPANLARLEEIRQAEVRRALARLPDASPETRAAIEGLSSAIVNKILHAPITKLRESSRAGTVRSWLELVHELFALGRRT